MTIPIRTPDPLAEYDRIQASLERAIASWEAMAGRPFRDPEPTPEQLERARRKADMAAMKLIGDWLDGREL